HGPSKQGDKRTLQQPIDCRGAIHRNAEVHQGFPVATRQMRAHEGFPLSKAIRDHQFLFHKVVLPSASCGLLREFDSLNESVEGVIKGNMVWLVIPFSVLLSWMYTSLDRVGESTENPFEGSANDIPISQMCRTAEIDLLEMLGETDCPPPLEPRHKIVL